MLDNELQREGNQTTIPQTILDLGCGNGRNSLYLAKKYKTSNVVLVDCDVSMLEWAQQLFNLHGVPAKSIQSTVEEVANDSLTKYTCKHSGYFVLDIFWNPSRLRVGEFIEIDRVNWYGLTYEELITLLAPRFRIVNDKVHRTNIDVMINMLLTPS